MKKKLFFVSLAVALVTAAVTVGVMFALGAFFDDDDDKEYSEKVRYEQLTGEIAPILDLDEQQVESAIKKAAAEGRQKALQGKLDSMVKKGTLSREQADAYLDWYKDKPDIPFPGPETRRFKGRQYAKPDVPSFRSGPRISILPFGRGQFREGPYIEGPLRGELPPFFGLELDGPGFWFRQDGDLVAPGSVICVFEADAFGEWWHEVCDDDYYKYDDYYDKDDRDDDYDGDDHDKDYRDYD